MSTWSLVSLMCIIYLNDGATFLGSMINQSKQIQMTPNSILPDVVINILKTRESSVFKNFETSEVYKIFY